MSRTSIPFSVSDISALAGSLLDQLAGCDHTPRHVELRNRPARSAGHRNYQSLRAQLAAQSRLERATVASMPPDYSKVEWLAHFFDEQGLLVSWPAKASLQSPCLWALWSKLALGRAFSRVERRPPVEARTSVRPLATSRSGRTL
jgi:hypothetical protein